MTEQVTEQVKIDREALQALYDLWRYFQFDVGPYDASDIGLVTAFDAEDAHELDRLADLVEPYEVKIKAALGLDAGCPLCGGKGMNFVPCARCGRQADPPIPCRRCGELSHGFACPMGLAEAEREARYR